jgi:predicted Ser/Thr protein kinase
LQQQWRSNLGIDAKIVAQPFNPWLQTILSGRYAGVTEYADWGFPLIATRLIVVACENLQMSPPPSIAHYRIQAKLGEGGMGEVWRATDTKLNRDVAIKVLPDAFSVDHDRMARFEREAQVLASLNHPNIAAIYGVEERAIVMELVEGETLRGPLSLEEALPIIHQLIDALEYAHEKGVVHRDLKPANIKITREGRVKVLDFGLAKAISADAAAGDPSTSPTLTMRATMAGVIMGTAAYMAPEQARGQEVDKRADIWAFGVVVWEILTGKRLFDGPTVSDTLAGVLRQELELAPIPLPLRQLVRTCLVRDVRRRMRDIGDARLLLEEAPVGPPPRVPSRAKLPWAIAALAMVVAAAGLWVGLRPKLPETEAVIRFADSVPVADVPNAIAFSRDGSRLAFAGGPRSQIYVRLMDQLEAKPLPGTEGAAFLCFSPDGEWISYITGDRATPDGHLNKVAVAGGPTQVLAKVSAVQSPPGHDWGQDGNIVFTSDGMLHRMPAAGSKSEIIAKPDTGSREANYSMPQVLPGGRAVLFTVDGRTAVLNLQSRQKKIVFERSGYTRYAPAEPGSAAGYLIYYARTSTGSLMSVPFDLNRLEVTGPPVPVLDRIRGTTVGPFGIFAFSDEGTLAYVPGAPGGGLKTLVWVDRRGTEQPVSIPTRAYRGLRLSPQGDRVALEIGASIDPAQRADIFTYDLIRGGLTRVTSENRNIAPVWTPDGNRLIYLSFTNSNNTTLVSAPADGSSPPPAYPISEAAPRRFSGSVSPDGKLVIGRNINTPGSAGNNFWVLPITEPSAAPAKFASLLDARFPKSNPQFSPDGHWLAYDSVDTGVSEIYAVAYPGPGPKFPVSTDGGTAPRWASNGRELFYVNGRKMMAVEIQLSPTFRAGSPKVLFERNMTAAGGASYDVAPDYKRFLMLQPASESQAERDQLNVVLHWFEELRRRVPGGR